MNHSHRINRKSILVIVLLALLAGCRGGETLSNDPAAAGLATTTDASPEPPASPLSIIAPTPATLPSTSALTQTPVTPVAESPTQPAPPPDAPAAALTAAAGYPAVEAIAAELSGLPIGEFFEASYTQLLLRDPESLTELGLSEVYGAPTDTLTDISDTTIRETQALERIILELLRGYERDALTPEDRLSYDIYEWYLDDRVRGHEFMYHNYPVTYFVTSVPTALKQFFTELHPLASRDDAEDYITRLGLVDEKFDQLIEGLQIREEMGIIPPRFVFQWTMPGIRAEAAGPAQDSDYYRAFVAKLGDVEGLTTAERDELAAAAAAEIEASVLPAYRALEAALLSMEGLATDDAGIWKLPNGDAFYKYALRHHTTTDLSAADIHALGQQDLERIHAEMRVIFDELGYPQDESLPALFGRVANDGGTLFGEDVVAGYEALIAEAQTRLGEAFDLRPQAEVAVIGVPSGGYYLQPAIDGTRPGAFYATATGAESRFAMPTLAYHEAVPGHHLQLAIMQELEGLPSFRNGITFTANVEGWALYAERLAKELGWYDDDPYGDLGRLQGEAFRAARLVVDTGIHDLGWTFEEAENYLVENAGLPRGMAQNQIARYIVWPGQATAYKIGMIEFLRVRDLYREALGDDYDLKDFHNLMLSNGSMPLTIMERIATEAAESRQ